MSDSGDQFSRALRAGRERQALMDAAVASFRALAVHERMQFLICIEADIASALAASSVTVATPIVVEKSAISDVCRCDDVDDRVAAEPRATAPIVKSRTGRWSKYDDAQIQRVLEMYAGGKSGCKIALETGIPQNSVYVMLKQHRGPLRELAPEPPAAPVVALPRTPTISPTLYVHTRKKVDRPVTREHHPGRPGSAARRRPLIPRTAQRSTSATSRGPARSSPRPRRSISPRSSRLPRSRCGTWS